MVKCRGRLFGNFHLGRMWFWDMAVFVFLEAKVVNLGPNYFQMSLPVILTWIIGKTNLESHLKKYGLNGQFSTQNRPWRHFCLNFEWYNSPFFYQIFTFDHTEMTSSARQSNGLKAKLCLMLFRFWFFCSIFRWTAFKASHGQHWAYGPKTTLKLLVLCGRK